MKKRLGILLLSGILLMANLLFAGCLGKKDDGLSYESDGMFRYHDCGNSYIIIGAEENLPETVYVPSHYKGKEIVSYNTVYTPPTTIGDGHEKYYSIRLNNAKRVYFPYNCIRDYFDLSSIYNMGLGKLNVGFYTSSEFTTGFFIELVRCFSKEENIERKIYVSQIGYKKCKSDIEKYTMNQSSAYSDQYFSYHIGSYKIKVEEYNSSAKKDCIFEFSIRIGNVSYLFNYESAPNDGYFFINEFERGGKIETTPYEPLREGYTFGGWYKESNCINEWNFDEDKLPEAEYDEEGELKFVETKLYAKWIKK